MRRNQVTWLVLGALLGCGVAACGGPMNSDAGDATSMGDSRSDGAPADRGADSTPPPPDGSGPEAGPDVMVKDVPVPEAGPDATPEAGPDAAPDGGMDASPEAGPDVVTMDATPDATMDAAPDAAPEAGADATPDAASDGGAGVCDPSRIINLSTAGTLMGATTRYTGTTSGTPTGAPLPGPMCTTSVGRELALHYTVRAASRLLISTTNPGTNVNFDTVVWALDRCAATGTMEYGCNDDNSAAGVRQSAFYTTSVLPAGTVVTIIVAGFSPPTGTPWVDNGAFELTVTETTDGAAGGECRTTSPACDAGLMCSGDPAFDLLAHCVSVVAIGGSCDTTGASNVCATGSLCVGTGATGTCVADGSAGGRCRTTGAPCNAMLGCNGPPTTTSSRCVPLVALGGTCDPMGVTNLCASPNVCTTAGSTSTCTVPPYPETRIAPMCDDLSTATAVPGVVGDDTASAPIALPFAFTFYGSAVSYYSVATNGFMQLWPDATGLPSSAFSNDPIPTDTDPNNFVAPFWDDLDVPATGSVRAATLGTAPNRRFVVEWRDVAFYASTGVTLRFQAKLFEGSNVIEFHYCTLTATDPTDMPRVTGGSATVGIEDATGTRGRQHSNDTPMSVSTTDAIRYTP